MSGVRSSPLSSRIAGLALRSVVGARWPHQACRRGRAPIGTCCRSFGGVHERLCGAVGSASRRQDFGGPHLLAESPVVRATRASSAGSCPCTAPGSSARPGPRAGVPAALAAPVPLALLQWRARTLRSGRGRPRASSCARQRKSRPRAERREFRHRSSWRIAPSEGSGRAHAPATTRRPPQTAIALGRPWLWTRRHHARDVAERIERRCMGNPRSAQDPLLDGHLTGRQRDDGHARTGRRGRPPGRAGPAAHRHGSRRRRSPCRASSAPSTRAERGRAKRRPSAASWRPWSARRTAPPPRGPGSARCSPSGPRRSPPSRAD